MKRIGILVVTATVMAVLVPLAMAERGTWPNRRGALRARSSSWHGPYYNTARGAPVPLVVPPIAHMQTRWGWGVSQGTMTPINHQFGRSYWGEGEVVAEQLYPTPAWPSHTDQMGVYYIRGPW